MKKRFLIYGWFGYENLGDELILKSIIEIIGNNNPNNVINVMGGRPKSIEKYHKGLNTVSTNFDLRFKSILRMFKYNPFKVIKNLFCNDYLIIGSGGALSDWNPESTVTLFFMINFFKKVLNKTIIILGAGAGPIIMEESMIKFKKVLEQVDCISLRDKESYDLLKEIGLNNIQLTNDVVYDFKDSFSNEDKPKNEKDKIGIVIAPLLLNSDKKRADYIKEMIKYIKRLEKYGFYIKLIPFQYEYDINFFKEIQKETDVDIYEYSNMWGILDEMKKYDLIVGMRFHSVVISILLNIPVLPIIYHSKVESCVKEFGLEFIAQSIGDGDNWVDSNIDSDKMIRDTVNLLNNKELEKQRIKDILDKKLQNKNVNIIQEFINN
ncbi:polysaccharide pyruvyl transferase family protein [Clostridium sp.]|uniref:polysaccharide pyruvyl transferase family protein n=1 Tax=Clostridium sp. TaxID=1506 RepID=UPI00284C7F90|nr:polysaccharide pyruvyl transferase family protein [Clostridium sp.]MDR3594809.1 polysaccharide pyruvyl transferase family protein [Clostridium sp.]